MRRPKKTVTIDLSSYLSAGTYNVKVKSKGTDIRDSEESNSVSCVVAASGYEVELSGTNGSYETLYVQINDDPTWYYARLEAAMGFSDGNSDIPNAYTKMLNYSIGIPNVVKIKFGTSSDPSYTSGPYYDSSRSSGDFVNLTFTVTGDSPLYVTNEITMTQDSKAYFIGDD